MSPAKKPAKVYLDGSRVKRPVDQWRSNAAVPLLPWSLTGDRATPGAPLVWTLDEDGKRVAQWREADAPGLGAWLDDRLTQLHGAWHVARIQLGIVRKSQIGGAKTAGDRKKAALARDTALTVAARKLLTKNPRLTNSDVARQLSDRGHGGFDALRRKLPKLIR